MNTVLTLLLVGAFASSTSAEDSCEPASAQQTLRGHYQFVGGEQEEEAWRQAILRATADMSVFIRNIARDRMRDKLPITKRYFFAVEGDEVTIGNPRNQVTAPNRQPVEAENEFGDEVAVTHEFDGARLVQTFDAEEGTRRNAFLSCNGGDLMILHVTVSADRLPQDLEYRATYRRVR